MSYIRNANNNFKIYIYFSYQRINIGYIIRQHFQLMISKKNLSHQLEIINNKKYENICPKLKQKNLSSSKKQQEEQQNQQKQENFTKNHQNSDFEDICFKLKNKVQLPKPSQALLLFYQSYENKLIQKLKDKQFYGLKQILVQFYTQEISLSKSQSDRISQQKSQQNDSQEIAPLNILIRPHYAVINRLQCNPFSIPFKDKVLFNEFTQDNILKELEQKLWLQINKKLNKISLHIGDIQSNEKNKTLLFSENLLLKNVKRENLDWKHCQKNLNQNGVQSKYQQKSIILQNLTHCKIFLKTYHKKVKQNNISSNKETSVNHQLSLISLAQNMSINIVQLQALRGPKIQQNPNLFNQSISSIYTLPSQIQTLYFRMKNMNLVTICKEYSNFKDYSYKLDQQLIGQAIHNSLTTPFGYFTDKQGTKIPIGILNHLLYVKTNKKYQSHINSTKLNKSPSQFYENLTNERKGYIRFQIIHPHNFYPGNCGILQIWPPFNCSPIHNHGQLIGVVKIFKGDLRVQNYLSLCRNKQKPYSTTDFHKGEYTWLCKESYGIHRIINAAPSTAISLQAYYDHNQGSEEYFTFIMKQSQDKNSPKFAKYYPQHDWLNYLNMNSIENQEDQNYIKELIEKYKLKKQYNKNQKQELDYSFGKFIEVLLKEYYLVRSYLDG